MAYEMKPNTGSLFKNDKREKDTQPHAKGQALIEGVEYWVSAWTNDGPKGKYQQLKYERKDANKDVKQVTPQRVPVSDMDSDIPF